MRTLLEEIDFDENYNLMNLGRVRSKRIVIFYLSKFLFLLVVSEEFLSDK